MLLYREVAAHYEDHAARCRDPRRVVAALLSDGGGAAARSRAAGGRRRALDRSTRRRRRRDPTLRPTRAACRHREYATHPRARRIAIPVDIDRRSRELGPSLLDRRRHALRAVRDAALELAAPHQRPQRPQRSTRLSAGGRRPTRGARSACSSRCFPSPRRSSQTTRSGHSRAAASEEATRFLRHALPGTSAPSGATASRVVLNYVPVAFGSFAGLTPEVEWVHPGHGDSVHALRLQVTDFAGTGRYVLHFDFNDAALEERLRRRSLEHFATLLDACLDDPDRPIAAVDILTADERQALAAINRTDLDASARADSCRAVRAPRACVPDTVALRQGGTTVSFAELRSQVALLAAALVAHGVVPGDRVVIASRRSIAAVVGILATLRARAAYVPLESSVPRARLAYMLEDSGARLVLVGDGMSLEPAPADVAVLRIADGIRAGPGAPSLDSGPRLDDLAYLMYTSGSTGRRRACSSITAGSPTICRWAERRYVRGDRLSVRAVHVAGVRPDGHEPVPAAHHRRHARDLPGVRRPGGHGADGRGAGERGRLHQAHAVASVRSAAHRSRPVANPPHGCRRRGSERRRSQPPSARSCAARSRSTTSTAPPKLWSDASRIATIRAADTGASVPIGVPADHVRVDILNHALAAVPEGVAGRAVGVALRARSRLSPAAGADGRTFHGPSATARRSRLPHRRPGADGRSRPRSSTSDASIGS